MYLLHKPHLCKKVHLKTSCMDAQRFLIWIQNKVTSEEGVGAQEMFTFPYTPFCTA